MQTVSTVFKNAILAPERRIKAKVDIVLFDNDAISITASTTASSTLIPPGFTTTPFSSGSVFDGISQIGRTVAVASPTGVVESNMTYPGPNLYPVPENNYAGWWSDVQSDSSGNLGTAQTLTIDYGADKNIQTISVIGDTNLNFPVAFQIHTATSAAPSTWVLFRDETNNTQAIYQYSAPATVSARYVRITITKISKPYRYPVILELSNGWTISTDNALVDRLVSIDITRESYFEDESSLPVGNYSAAECTIELDNTDGAFYQRNKQSQYYGYLTPNKKVRVQLGVYTGINSDGTTTDPAADQTGSTKGYTFLPLGTFYTLGFQGGLGQPTVKITCHDRVKRLRERQYENSYVYQNYTISQLLTILCQAAGMDASEYVIDTTTDAINFAYFEKKPYWDLMRELTVAETGYIRIDERDRVVFKDRYFYWSSRARGDNFMGATVVNVYYTGGLKVGDKVFFVKSTTGQEYLHTVSAVDAVNNQITISPGLNFGADDQTYVYKANPDNSSPVAITLTTSNAISDADDEFSLDRMKNKVVVKATPYVLRKDGTSGSSVAERWKNVDGFRLAAPGVTWPYSVTAGGTTYTNTVTDTKVFTVEFKDKPVIAGTFTKVDGTSVTYTPSISVTVVELDSSGNILNGGAVYVDPAYIQKTWVNTDGSGKPFAWGGYLQIKNTNSGHYYNVTGVFVYADALEKDSTTMLVTAQDNVLINTYGEKTYELENQYITNERHANGVATNLLNQFKDPSAGPIKVSLPVRGLFHIQVGDRIKINSSIAGLTDLNKNNHFYVVRQSFGFDGSLDGTFECVPAN